MRSAQRHNRHSVASHCSEKIKPEHCSAFARAVNLLNSTMDAVRAYEPEANYYQECESLHLMTGPSHDDTLAAPARPDRSALSAIITYGDTGAW